MRKLSLFLILYFLITLLGICYSNTLPRVKNVKVKAEVSYDSDKQIYTYSYTITNPIESELPIGVIVIDATILPDGGGSGYDWNSLAHEKGFEPPSEPFIEEDFPIDVPFKSIEEMVEYEQHVRIVYFGTFSPEGWEGAFSYEDKYTSILEVPAAARWGALAGYNILPGQELSGFVLTSAILPGIREIAFKPDIHSNEGILDSGLVPEEWFPYGEDDPELGIKLTQLYYNVEHSVCYKTKTIGPTPPPASFIPTEFALRINNFVNEAEALGWIIDHSLAEALRNLLDQIYQAILLQDYLQAQLLLQQFMQLIQSSNPEQRTSEAEGLLYYNAKYLYDNNIWQIPISIEPQALESVRPSTTILHRLKQE